MLLFHVSRVRVFIYLATIHGNPEILSYARLFQLESVLLLCDNLHPLSSKRSLLLNSTTLKNLEIFVSQPYNMEEVSCPPLSFLSVCLFLLSLSVCRFLLPRCCVCALLFPLCSCLHSGTVRALGSIGVFCSVGRMQHARLCWLMISFRY